MSGLLQDIYGGTANLGTQLGTAAFNLFNPVQSQPTQQYWSADVGANLPQSHPAGQITPTAASTGPSRAPTTNPVTTNNGNNNNVQTVDPYAQLRGDINNGWDSYTNQLNDTLNVGLPGQRDAQQGIADTQYQQGQDTINSQKTKSLNDIANNIHNAFQAGNVYLGARGAGDSSAANQYSFALNKEAGKQTGNLNEFVNTQLNNLQSQHSTQLQQIAQWFNDAQNQIRSQIGQAGLGRSKDLEALSQNVLNQALSQVQQINQAASTQYNALTQWATANAQSLPGLQSQLASIPQPIAAPMVDSSGNFRVPVGYGGGTNDQFNMQNPALFQGR